MELPLTAEQKRDQRKPENENRHEMKPEHAPIIVRYTPAEIDAIVAARTERLASWKDETLAKCREVHRGECDIEHQRLPAQTKPGEDFPDDTPTADGLFSV